jgi:16S rRNA (uracil1498-N3)-methyltransferase
MALPFFYKEYITPSSKEIILDEPTSKHIVQVLRMQNGEQLQLTNGKGIVFTTEIIDNNRKKCRLTILKTSNIQLPTSNITIAISPIKNTTRFEWFLEKATEIGINEIIPLICERTEKTSFKVERMNNILISAMLQSQQCWLPHLHEPIRFDDLVIWRFENCEKYIAHCENEENKKSLHRQITKSPNQFICIGPEGDFTKAEIELALTNNFIPVSLGKTRLRTETAGIVAATLLCVVQ